MKKLLSLIGAISIVGSGASAVVACGTKEGSTFNWNDLSTYGESQKAEIGNLLAGLISLEMKHNAAQNNQITLNDLQGQGKYIKILDSAIIRAVQNITEVSLFPKPANGTETLPISYKTINDYATLKIKAVTPGISTGTPLTAGNKLALTITAKPDNPLLLKNALTVDFTLTDKINLNILPKTIVVDQKPATESWTPETVKTGMITYITNWINNFLPKGSEFTTSEIQSQLNFSKIPQQTLNNYITYPVTITGNAGSTLFANSDVNRNFVIGYSFKPTDDGASDKGVGITLTPPTDPSKFALTDFPQWKTFFTGLPNLVVPTINAWLQNKYSTSADNAPQIRSTDLRIDFLPLLYQVVKDFTGGSKTFDFTKVTYLTVSFASNSAVNTTELALSLKIKWVTPSAKI